MTEVRKRFPSPPLRSVPESPIRATPLRTYPPPFADQPKSTPWCNYHGSCNHSTEECRILRDRHQASQSAPPRSHRKRKWCTLHGAAGHSTDECRKQRTTQPSASPPPRTQETSHATPTGAPPPPRPQHGSIKWCSYHKVFGHNVEECRVIQSRRAAKRHPPPAARCRPFPPIRKRRSKSPSPEPEGYDMPTA
ncbi:hypothetical protein Dimus_039440 [Dionaea muscipula]